MQIVCNLVTYARNVLESSAPRACVALLARLGRLARAHDKLLATAAHRLRALPTMALDGTRRPTRAGGHAGGY